MPSPREGGEKVPEGRMRGFAALTQESLNAIQDCCQKHILSCMSLFMPRPWRDAHTDRARALRQSSTDAERHLWNALRNRKLGGLKFRRQHAIGNYIADFVCLERRLIVELDGGQHADATAYDAARSAWLATQGFRVVRLWNTEFFEDLERAKGAIWAALHEDLPSPHEDAGLSGGT